MLSTMMSPRTAKYVEAKIHEGDKFNFHRWLQRVREEEAQAKQVPVAFTFGESAAPEIGDMTNTPACHDAWASVRPALRAKSATIRTVVYRSDLEPGSKAKKGELRQRLVMVCNAWDDFQECRKRDAVYGYLKAVFALVVDCKGHRQTTRLLRRAFRFAGLPVDKNPDPFAAVIRCTSERNVDNKTISKWARALRYAAHCKRPRTTLKAFIKKMGGINACAERHAVYLGRGGR
jgi:hypothetical protein